MNGPVERTRNTHARTTKNDSTSPIKKFTCRASIFFLDFSQLLNFLIKSCQLKMFTQM